MRINKFTYNVAQESFSKGQDIVFMVDATGSMAWNFKTIIALINNFMRTETHYRSRFAVVSYKDHTKDEDFSSKGLLTLYDSRF